MMIRQFRYPLAQIFWEIPAGKIDAGEDEDTTARRELREETGVVTNDFAYIGHFYPGIGYSDEVIHIYTAWNLASTSQNMDKDEFVTRTRIPFSEAINMVHSGEITDGKTIVCLLRTWEWWAEKGSFKL
jgi:ADP-ribose pyrophosphatase